MEWHRESKAHPGRDSITGVTAAVRHALAWLVFGNSVGLFLSILLLHPEWQMGIWSYGRWVPVHLNAQLYGWTALPLVGWLFTMYEVEASKVRHWASAAVWAWTAALAFAAWQWLGGGSSGKIFLDWKNNALWAFVIALSILWMVLCAAWLDRARLWSKMRRGITFAGLLGLAMVPVAMMIAASPRTYPPIDPATGGPTGSSLLGSTLIVIGLMLLLPRAAGCAGKGRAGWGTWGLFLVSWPVFAVTEAMGGTHFDGWQILAMLFLVPWAWLIPKDWKGFEWPENSGIWRGAMLGWWGLLVMTGVGMYAPGVLDHIKFTQALVGHSHLAMAGFTTSFCALLILLLLRRPLGTWKSAAVWHGAAFLMILTLAIMGWREGMDQEWMIVHATWRDVGFIIRSLCGAAMLASSLVWLRNHLNA